MDIDAGTFSEPMIRALVRDGWTVRLVASYGRYYTFEATRDGMAFQVQVEEKF
jgi:hypothetical protein